jgi:hypothetical protein
MVLLPGLEPDQLEDVVFQVDRDDEQLLNVYCIYESNGEAPEVDYYPIDIHQGNRDQIDVLNNLIVEHHAEYTPEDLTDNPEERIQVQQLFDELRRLEELMETGEEDSA